MHGILKWWGKNSYDLTKFEFEFAIQLVLNGHMHSIMREVGA